MLAAVLVIIKDFWFMVIWGFMPAGTRVAVPMYVRVHAHTCGTL